VIDRSTRWAEAIPIADTSAAGCAEAFFQGWVGRFGVPDTLTSDRGSQFSSEVWAAVCKRLNIRHCMTTAYHPQANGMVERLHRRLKEALRARLPGEEWLQHLPWVMLGLRTAPREDSAVSAAELALHSKLVLPGELLLPRAAAEADLVRELKSDMTAFSPLPVRAAPPQPAAIPESLRGVLYVYVRRDGYAPPLAAKYDGPFKVLGAGPKFFRIQVGARVECVTVDRLKPHLGAGPVVAAEPRRRGRPPRATK
jgi:hypothetical protein